MGRWISVPLKTLVCVLSALILLPGRSLAGDTLLTIEWGRIRGTVETPGSPVRVFRGIPYALPPVGELRWKPPQPAAPWDGVRDCLEFGPSCIQPDQKIVPGVRGKQSEDCLTLNVWTAASAGAKRPVMVWIHRGRILDRERIAGDVRRSSFRGGRGRRGHDQLPARAVRIHGAPGAERGVAGARVGKLRSP